MNNALEHKFPQFTDEQLREEVRSLTSKVQAIQRSKQHHSQRESLSGYQSVLHRMNMELKRRDSETKRAKHSITPSAK